MSRDVGASESSDRIAIVGMACALPGGIDSPLALWQFLRRGGDAVIDIPSDRWNVAAVFDPEPGTPGKAASRWAGLLLDISGFDAGFFGISPREAAVMDPQQRLLLEVAWRALEDAGIPAERLAGTRTGVYVGISHSDYNAIQQFDRRQIDVHTATGGALSIAANRLSHRFDLRGPSLAIDTACSSSLVALDAACTALLTGTCDAALAGGVNVILTPDVTITFSRAAMLSPDGRCKAFDARANGYVRGEGAGMVVLKPLARALLDSDRVHAVIRATAVNQDGHTSTITVPSREAQIAMLREACAKANVQPSEIGYVEAHGTGTAVGDPIEANAIGTVFGHGRAPDNPCAVGSIKTNIGHLEPAAGIAGLIKAAMCVREGEIPPSLHFESPNPNIDFDRLGIRVQRKLAPWPATTGPRFAAVNSFGFGGTNACAIVEQPPRSGDPALASAPKTPWPTLLPVSAATKAALAATCGRLADVLSERRLDFVDVAGTLAVRRSHLDHRLVIQARTPEDAVAALRDLAAERECPAAISGRRTSNARLAFAFGGQGSQWWGMGRGLLQQDPLFRNVVERCDDLFRQRSGWSVIEQLLQPEDRSRINETSIAQPAIFALQIGLAERLMAWGIQPEAVVGHSIGEIAASYVAGALSLAEAIDVVFHRSRLQERSRLQGGMAAIGLSAEGALPYLEKFDGQLEIAAVNGPELVTIAGPRALLDGLVEEVGRNGNNVLRQILRVDYAFHSRQMEAFQDELRSSLHHLRPRAPRIPMFSTVTGELVAGEQLDAEYWCCNMRRPVLFKHAAERVIDSGFDRLVEVSAHPSLLTPLRACFAGRSRAGFAVATLHRERPDMDALTSSAASLHVHGVSLDWRALSPPNWRFVEVPGHPWEKQACWAESEEARAARFDGPSHPLLGYRLKTTDPVWHSQVDANYPRYLNDHRIEGAIVFPAAGYIELMLAAAHQTLGDRPHELERICFHEALFLTSETATLLQTSVDEARGIVRVHTRQRGSDAAWKLRASSLVRAWTGPEPVLEKWLPDMEPPKEVGHARFYRDLAEEGHTFGPAFQGVESVFYAEGYAVGKIALPSSIADADQYLLHPVRLDSCLQVIRGIRGFGPETRPGATLAIPAEIGRMRMFFRPAGTVYACVKVVEDRPDEIVSEISIIDDTGRIAASIEDFRCLRVERSTRERQAAGGGYYQERWVPLPAAAIAPVEDAAGSWLILSDRRGVGEALAASIEERGGQATVLFQGRRNRSVAERHHEVHPTAAGFGNILERMDHKPTRVVHLWSLDHDASQVTTGRFPRTSLEGLETLLAFVQSLVRQRSNPRLWLVTGGVDPACDGAKFAPASVLHAGLLGFLRSLANEHPEFRPTCIDLDAESATADVLLAEILGGSDETEVAFRGGERLGCRLDQITETVLPPRRRPWNPATRMPAFRVEMPAPGSIENLVLAGTNPPEPQDGEVLVEVRAAGLNFRDAMAATGILPAGAERRPAWQWLGLECAGVVRAVGPNVDANLIGRRVIASVPGCLASHIVVPTENIFQVPRRFSFEEAAAIPVAFATAYHALVTLGRLAPGEKILIHAAAGGVGLAAVTIAKQRGAEIFATAGSPEKRRYLHQRGVAHVFDSRSLAFADEVMWKTGGLGVDVVLNSLPGRFLEKSLSILAPGGRFLEIGKRDIYADAPLGLYAMRNNAAFFAIDLAKLDAEQPHSLRKTIETVIDGLERGRLEPAPVTTFPVSRVADAFRHMLAARQIGKIVISFDDEAASVRERPDARLPISDDATYVVTGGTRGLGLETARWLVENGARSLVLVGRSAELTPEAEMALAGLRAAGAAAIPMSADIATSAGARAVIAAAKATGKPLRGVVHAAGTIDDALIAKLTLDQVRRVFSGKVAGAWRLHELTKSLPLDFFVLYSSIAATLGSPGQAHYAAANRLLDAIAAYRRSRGLPATSIAFGPVSDRGYLSSRQEVTRYVEDVGMQPIPAATALSTLGTALRCAPLNMAFAPINWSRLAQAFPLVASARRTSSLTQVLRFGKPGSDRQVRGAILAAGLGQRQGIVEDYLHRQVAGVLKIDPKSIEIERPLPEIGLDSLTALELKNRIESELGVSLPLSNFLQRPTIATIVPAIIETINDETRPAIDAVEANTSTSVMSIGQEALWFVDRLDPGNPAYGLAACVAFRPHLNDEHIDQIIFRLVSRYDNLRLVFPADSIGPLPKLLPAELCKLIRYDACAVGESEFSALLRQEANRPFDLEQGPLTRLHLFRRVDKDFVLVQFHHIAADAASIAILLHEVIEGYLALQAGLPLPAPPNRAQFPQFATWQRALVDGPEGVRHREFWRHYLADAPPFMPLATDRPRPLVPLGPGASQSFIVRGVIVEELKGFARAEGATLFSLLLAALNVLLHQHTGSSDLVVGAPANGRTRPEFERMVGYLVNALPIRSRFSRNDTFQELLKMVTASVGSALEHQDYPFSMIVRDLDPPRDPGRSPIFQIMFGMERFDSADPRGLAATLLNMAGPKVEFGEFTIESVAVTRNRAPFELTFTIEEFADQIFGVVDYRHDLWEHETVERLIEDYQAILRQIVSAPLGKISDFLADRNAAAPIHGPFLVDRPDPVACLRAVAAARPDAIAVTDNGGDVSYATLLGRVEALAAAMIDRGVGRETCVGICVSRNCDLPTAILAVLHAGAAYVPLDPSYPAHRLAMMIADTDPRIVIVDRWTAEFIPDGTPLLFTDEPDRRAGGAAPCPAEAHDLAYIIHTSGSTGRPTGVEIEREGLANFLAAMRTALPVSSGDSLLAVTPYSFDIAALELLLPLTIGARLVIANEHVARDGWKLRERIEDGDITVMQATPATWQMLIDAGWARSRQLTALCGGEALTPALAAGILARVEALWNLYGPTETTIWSTIAQVTDGNAAVPIGRPIANTVCLVVDESLEPVRSGATGELLIGGAGLARGYRNDPERTAHRFIPDPVGNDGRSRVFRTGDYARVRPDGALEFVGRRDQQVKVRGFRIELPEIEATLRTHPSVRDAVVLLLGHELLDRRLFAFAISDPEAIDADDLVAHLRDRLPPYMVPDAIRITSNVPRLPNGKIDRARLAGLAQLPVPAGRESSEARTPVEVQLLAILKDILRCDRLGVNDNFFSLGGTSLLGMRYVSRIANVYGVALGAADLLRAPTVAMMAELVSRRLSGAGVSAISKSAPTSAAPISRNLWRPLPLARAEGAFDEIDAAAIAYLPDDLLQAAQDIGAESTLRRQLPHDDPQWAAVCHLPLGRIAIVVVPRFGLDLATDPNTAVCAVDAAAEFAVRLGAKAVALTGLIPAVTDLGRALAPRNGMAITTGHATTASVIVMTSVSAAHAAGRPRLGEPIAFVGLGAIGTATLQLMLDQNLFPTSLTLCDVPAHHERLEQLAHEARNKLGFKGDIRIVTSNGSAPEEVYQSRFIVGATSMRGVLDVERLLAGTIVVDDSFPHCFNPADAADRMTSHGDVLLVNGGLVSPPGSMKWDVALPRGWAAMGIKNGPPETGLMFAANEITGCILSSLLTSSRGAPPTTGPVTVERCREHLQLLQALGVRAVLRCGGWSPNETYLSRFRSRYAQPGA
jgi:amino acid adenylation domain-containing protein